MTVLDAIPLDDTKMSEVDQAQTFSPRASDSADAHSIDLCAPSRLYHIYHSALHYDYRVSDANKNHLYFIHNSVLKPLKPDITVHAGADDAAPTLAVCKFIHFSRHCKIGLGDPQHPGAMVWEDLECQNLTMTMYRWQMSVSLENGRIERRCFVWKRTHSLGVDGESPPVFSLRNFKLVDDLTGQVVAVFTSNGLKSARKNGKLQVVADYGPHFDIMTLTTLVAIYERIRRRTGGKGGGGSGGGDGG